MDGGLADSVQGQIGVYGIYVVPTAESLFVFSCEQETFGIFQDFLGILDLLNTLDIVSRARTGGRRSYH